MKTGSEKKNRRKKAQGAQKEDKTRDFLNSISCLPLLISFVSLVPFCGHSVFVLIRVFCVHLRLLFLSRVRPEQEPQHAVEAPAPGGLVVRPARDHLRA